MSSSGPGPGQEKGSWGSGCPSEGINNKLILSSLMYGQNSIRKNEFCWGHPVQGVPQKMKTFFEDSSTHKLWAKIKSIGVYESSGSQF